MKILTWNINSVRLRINQLLRVMDTYSPDIVCLQETKTPDEFFPRAAVEEAGYKHNFIHGMKSYNGVAILARVPFESPRTYQRVGQPDCRHISAQFQGFELHNLYIPAGGYEADVNVNPKFQHKLDFVDEMAVWFKDQYTPDQSMIAVGDFNIAPYEHDVWSHKQLLSVVSHTPDETTRMEKMRRSLDWVDTRTRFMKDDEKVYTWWSYRNQDWQKSNRGRRLDHIWVTRPLEKALQEKMIAVETRSWEQPSDHVPVMVTLKL
jgi:exodeoxyribonuclease-3